MLVIAHTDLTFLLLVLGVAFDPAVLIVWMLILQQHLGMLLEPAVPFSAILTSSAS